MKDNEWVDYSIMYNQRHKSFYRWVIYPIICLFIFLGIFLFFAKTEIVIRTTAQLTPLDTRKIQVPLDTLVNENYLKENLKVKKGDTLVTFETEELLNEKKFLETENSKLEEQIKASNLFTDSVLAGTNKFSEDDSYGYSNKLNAFFAEKSAINLSEQQVIETSNNEKENYQNIKNNLEQQLLNIQNDQKELNRVRVAWINKQEIQDISKELSSTYKMWQEQIKNLPEEQKEQENITILSTIDEQISIINKEATQLNENISSLISPISLENEIKIQKEKSLQIQEEILATNKQEIVEINNKKDENTVLLNNLIKQIQLGTIKSPIAGTIHVIEKINKYDQLPKGTLLAEIYPVNTNDHLIFTAQIPASEMTRVKTGLNVHFKLDKKGVSPKVINGKLIEISEMSTTNEQGIYYTVQGELYPEEELAFRYGLTGELSMILGQKTYWEKIKDILLNQE